MSNKKTDGVIKYATKGDIKLFQLFSSAEVAEHHAEKLIEYLEGCVHFTMPPPNAGSDDEVVLNCGQTLGDPTEILGNIYFTFAPIGLKPVDPEATPKLIHFILTL